MGRCKRDETRCDIEIATLRNELEKAEAAIDAVLNLYPNLENYIDSARRDAKGEG